MGKARLGASVVALIALSTASCSIPDFVTGSKPTQAETTGAAAKLPGEVINSVELRPGETARTLLGHSVVVSKRAEDGQTTIRIVNRDNGATLWSTTGQFPGQQVQLKGTADKAIVVTLTDSEDKQLLVGLDPATGHVLWANTHAGGQVKVVRGTGTALVATPSVPIVLDTATGDELWRGEPGDQMQAVLGAALVTASDGQRQALRLRDGSRIPGGIKSSDLNLAKATSSGPDTWLLGKGALALNGIVKWGEPGSESYAIVGDTEDVAIVTKKSDTKAKKKELALKIHRTESGASQKSVTLDVCRKGKAVGLTDGVLTWACPTEGNQTIVNVQVS
jgi:outer membrane protein assembly factor BamB